jgi:hypothetical protein
MGNSEYRPSGEKLFYGFCGLFYGKCPSFDLRKLHQRIYEAKASK